MGETPHAVGVLDSYASRTDPAKEIEMPKVSKTSAAQVDERGPGKEWHAELDGYKASFVSVSADVDLTELLRGLPGDRCDCPHWGYVLKGRMWFRFGDREESYEAGDAFHAPGGHTSGADADSDFLVFSPTELISAVEAHMMQRAQQLQST
jgi:hypothetical protein